MGQGGRGGYGGGGLVQVGRHGLGEGGGGGQGGRQKERETYAHGKRG